MGKQIKTECLSVYLQLSSELGALTDTPGLLPNGDGVASGVDLSTAEDIAHQLEKEHQDYWQQSRYLSEKLTALQNEVADFKQEEEDGGSPLPLVRGTGGEGGKKRKDVATTSQRLHASIVRQSSHKHYTYDKVRK